MSQAPSVVEHKGMSFLIINAPTDSTLPYYLNEFKKHNSKTVVRVCEPTYKTQLLENEGIKVLDWAYPDGQPPPENIVKDWLALVNATFHNNNNNNNNNNNSDSNSNGINDEESYSSNGSKNNAFSIAIHCVAGLGRAPVLVAIALIEAGTPAEEAVILIRKVRRGAINSKQLMYLTKYKPRSPHNGIGSCCTLL